MNCTLGLYLTKAFNGTEIRQRPSDGYIDATAMCKVKPGKKIAQWNLNNDTHAFLSALSSSIGIPTLEIVQSKTGGDHAGTWVHPKAAIHLAMWVSPEFAVQVIDWVSRFISGDLTLVADLAAQHEALYPIHTTFVTVTTGGSEINPESVNLLHQDNVMAQDTVKVRIAEVKRNEATGEEELHLLVARLQEEKEKMEAQIGELGKNLAALSESKTELQRECGDKRRRLETTQGQLSTTTKMSRVLDAHYTANRADLEQFATAEELSGVFSGEQPLADSKAARYVALKGVTANTSGRDNRIVRDLNRNTFDSIGQNLTKWSLLNHPSRAQKMSVLSHILDYDFDADTERTPYGSVSWRCLLYKLFKTKMALDYSTHATLRDMHGLTRQTNTWFQSHGMRLEYHLVEQRDLEQVLGLVDHPAIGFATEQRDIRQWLTWREGEQKVSPNNN
jgi:hypothetical protein